MPKKEQSRQVEKAFHVLQLLYWNFKSMHAESRGTVVQR